MKDWHVLFLSAQLHLMLAVLCQLAGARAWSLLWFVSFLFLGCTACSMMEKGKTNESTRI